MNLLTGSQLHSLEHASKKISVIHSTCLNLETHALIKQTADQIIVVSHMNLKERYGLDCDIASFDEKDLYVHRTKIGNPPAVTYYELSKKLTEDKLTLDEIINKMTNKPSPVPKFSVSISNATIGCSHAII